MKKRFKLSPVLVILFVIVNISFILAEDTLNKPIEKISVYGFDDNLFSTDIIDGNYHRNFGIEIQGKNCEDICWKECVTVKKGKEIKKLCTSSISKKEPIDPFIQIWWNDFPKGFSTSSTFVLVKEINLIKKIKNQDPESHSSRLYISDMDIKIITKNVI